MVQFQLTRLDTVLLAMVALMIFMWTGWLVAFFYRQRQIDLLSEIPSLFPNKQSRFDSVDGVKIHYSVQGQGPDAILLHGLAANIYTWRELIPFLAAKTRVWALDIKGFGLSDKPRDGHYDLPSQAKLITHFLEAQGVTKCVAVGNSMGGAIAAEMFLTRPDLITKLVLIDSAHDASFVRLPSSPLKWFLKCLGYLTVFFSPFVTQETVKFYIRILYGSPKEITKEHVSAYIIPYMQGRAALRSFLESFGALTEGNLLERLEKAKARPLILWGALDRVMPLRFAYKLHEKIPGSILEINPTSGHHVQEEDPAWVSKHILDFISKNF